MNRLSTACMNLTAPFPDGCLHCEVWGIEGLLPAFQTDTIYVGAAICVISIIFAGVQIRDGRMSGAMPGISAAVFGMSACIWATGWVPFILLARTTEAALFLLVVITVVLSRAETNRDTQQAPAIHAPKEDQQ